jgi:hypothetical protein
MDPALKVRADWLNTGDQGATPKSQPIQANGGTTDVNPANQQIASPIVARYAQPAQETNPLTKARADLMKTYDQPAPDQAAIREQVRQKMQGQVDAINSYYDTLSQRENQAGQVRLDKTRGINVRAGLSGSDFAAANTEGVARDNKAAMNALDAERNAKVSAVLLDIEDRASKQYETERTLAQSNAEKKVSLMGQITDKAKENIKSLAASGFKFEKFKADPVYEQLKKEAGMTDFELDALYQASMPKKAAKDVHYEKLSNGKVAAFWLGDDGAVQKQEYDFQVPEDKKLRVIGGVPYYEDPATQTLTKASGFVPKPTTVNINDMSPKQLASFNQIVNKYQSSPLIAAADKMGGYLNTITTAEKNKSPQNDLALIYSFVKALDYGESAVREGEITLGMNTGSLRQQAEAQITKLQGGGLLADDQRRKYVDAAKDLINSVNSSAKKKEQMFKSQANVNGISTQWDNFRGGFTASYDQTDNAAPAEGDTVTDASGLPEGSVVEGDDGIQYTVVGGQLQPND